MKIQTLLEFNVLAKDLNFRGAAKRLGMQQSVLSKHIAALEEELGVTLLKRGGRVTLTDMGKIFFPESEKITRQYEGAILKLGQAAADGQCEVRVGFLHLAVRDMLAEAANEFRKQCPGVKLSLVPEDYRELIDLLKADKIDIALTIGFGNAYFEKYDVRWISADEWRACVPAAHPLAGRGQISLHDLAGEDILMPERDALYGFAPFQYALFKKAGIKPKIAGSYGHVRSALIMAEAGQGAALLPGHLAADAPDALRFLRLSEQDSQDKKDKQDKQYCLDIIALSQKKNTNEHISKFLDILCNRAAFDYFTAG
ncbi:MAG: LysR family transcriptional regulator [Clostridiales Family XIII bacterium]|jgi:DNA-binding transcriptional LysR family regulator|nr:LysR family transcriptional regulator [Clostridiales Family XIII bacterium]